MQSVPEARSTLPDFAPYVPTSYSTRVFSAVRSAVWVTLVQDNPLTWWWRQGRRNDRADMEGTSACMPSPIPDVTSRQVLSTCGEHRVVR